MVSNKFVKDVGILGIAQFFTIIGQIILLPIFTKILGPLAYGLWIQTFITTSFLIPFISLGIPYAMIRFLPSLKNKKDIQEDFYSALTLIFVLSLIVSILLFVNSESIANAVFEGEKQIVELISFILPLEGLFLICITYFRAFREMKKYSMFIVVRSYGDIIVASYMILTGNELFNVIISVLIFHGILSLIALVYIIMQIGITVPKHVHTIEYIKFSLPTLPFKISSWTISSSDRYVIAFFLGASFIGFYSPAYSIGFMVATLAEILNIVLLPTLSKLYDDEKINEVKIYLKYSLKYFLMLAIPYVFGVSLLSKQILIILSTNEIAHEGYLVVPFVAASGLFFGISSIMIQSISISKKTKVLAFVWLSAAILNILMNLIMVPLIGIIGAAIATLFAYLLATTTLFYFSFKYIRFDIEKRFIIKSIFSSFVMAIIILTWDPIKTFDILLCILSSIVTYFLALSVLNGFKKDEIIFFKNLTKI